MKTASNSEIAESVINFLLLLLWHGRYLWAAMIGYYVGVKL